MTESKMIVVGVDGSKESRRALDWALEKAAYERAEILAVSTWTPPQVPLDPPFGSFPWGADTNPVDEVRKMLNQVVDEATAEHPGVQVRQHVVSGNAAAELIRLSEEASMVVVGSKGHGGFSGMLLGSVSQHVQAHSACTVVVVR